MVWKEIGTSSASTHSTLRKIEEFNPIYSLCDSLSPVAKNVFVEFIINENLLKYNSGKSRSFFPEATGLISKQRDV